MTHLKPLLLATILSVSAAAAQVDCPFGWLPNTYRDTRCCAGNMLIEGRTAYCCVDDMRPYKEALTNTAKRYETETTTTSEVAWSTMDQDTCFAKIPFTASDYSAQVSSALSKAEATHTTTTTTSEVATTSATSGLGSQSSTPTPTPTSNVAMPLATAGEAVLGGAALAAALFVL